MQSDPTRFPAWLKWLMTTTVIGLILGLIGPYGSYLNGPAHLRIFYWVGMSWVGTAILAPSIIAALHLARRWEVPQWLTIAIAMLLAALPLSGAVAWIATRLWPELTFLGRADWYAQVLLVCMLHAGAYLLIARPPSSRAAARVHRDDDEPAPIPRGHCLCLQMEDHYVRIHGPAGSRLEHSTLARAIADHGGRDGLQIHRSWWVARSAVAEVIEDGRSVRLRLVNGLVAPVSRGRISALRAAGWLNSGAGGATTE
ncbi:LytTR family DNA-binding domain-containing protein [Sphingosinicella sp. BN140058]|uniref:LytTR family DNA-binding domain-containing protein n=1 Tax=Sphingosinicella sp. BN140058 TaxID=1892855 RepID=UPI001012FB0C|nr:LytTR family DNA-binding domain-containing protein [Sphingosinicella sp. BN140058]QAY76405.1 LytTR family transcriptional regulator [Sphingosinicella sp. BN140058]